jgi:hypothetical protein
VAESRPPLPDSKADDEAFYMLELLLVHPEPLTEWRFQASFTDTSVSPAKTVILDDLTVRMNVPYRKCIFMSLIKGGMLRCRSTGTIACYSTGHRPLKRQCCLDTLTRSCTSSASAGHATYVL